MISSMIAAGFVEVTDSPEAFFTALVVSVAYLFFVFLPLLRLRRATREAGRGPAALLASTLLLPLAVREVAVLIQGPHWRDWHFIWLYLIASVLLLGTGHSIAALLRFATRQAQKMKGRSEC